MEQQRSGTPSRPSGPSAHLPPSGEERGDLAFELVHATEAAALACSVFMGRSDPEAVSEAAMEAIRQTLERSDLAGTVVRSPRHQTTLPPGTLLGRGERPVDLGIYAIEGASQVARGHINAITVVVAVEPGGFATLPAVSHIEKFVAAAASRGAVDLDDSVADNLRRIAFSRDLRVQDLTVAILERPRHQDVIGEVAATGARIRTLEEGDFASAVMAALPGTGIDAAIGVGDLHANLMAACAVRCLGGEMQARLVVRTDDERRMIGEGTSRVYKLTEMAPASDIAVAITGVSGGPLLPGVMLGSGYAETSSLVMSSLRGTVRRLTTRHHLPGAQPR